MSLKTENCVICGKKATKWHAHVVGGKKVALGYIPVKVISGFCDSHTENEESATIGIPYNPELMGKCIPLFDSDSDLT